MYLIKIISICFITLFTSQLVYSQSVDQNKLIVVIDPGHGGKDNGTCGKHSKEKVITLSIAKKLKTYLANHAPQIQSFLTRESDEFINLNDRSGLANSLQADLFISIHCNHLHLPSVHGSEIYIMGLEKSAENIEIVKRENNSYFHEQGMPGHTSDSDENHILMNMFQYNYLNESAEFANLLLNNMKSRTSIKQRGVKQAGFVVLKRAGMPGVLFESAYLSNPKDEAYLMSEIGQEKIVQSLGEAIINYLNTPIEIESSQNRYTILLHQSETKMTQSMEAKWAFVPQFYVEEENGVYNYLSGNYTQFSEVEKQRNYYLSKGFVNAKILLIPKDSSEE